MSVLPLYVLADRSGSMAETAGRGTAIDVVNTVLRDLLVRLAKDPTIQRATRLSVISFADDARVELPLTRLSSTTSVPELDASGPTSFATVFETTAEAVVRDLAALGPSRPPLVFMLTDGRPTAHRDRTRGWSAEHGALLASAGEGRRVLLVPYGYGRVDEGALAAIASDPSAAYLAGRSDSPAQAIERFAELVFGSVARSVAMDSEQVVPPAGTVRPYDEDY
ncbi:vWA domain-containing protein [Streptomyces spongiae]|uniref:VWA domain-containing protein n=1 Tax=Streptomyces spongiae TaxID=565072 RepID=A0A5N8XS51_9ACTN|nr:VWA domain-containing protein [Streptomyces spongiae]MPY61445.1 VWA domain-containing protein [Streptomyces spongiae]